MHGNHVKSVIREQPDHIVFHIGTNDLPSIKSPQEKAKSITDLASANNNL